jgi:addiction module RelE/StbE family toxin
VAEVIYTRQALGDFERIFEFLLAIDPQAARTAVTVIQDAVGILERHPLIGRPAEHNLHELMISRGHSGYVALYEYVESADVILVLVLRHQREAGYPEP